MGLGFSSDRTSSDDDDHNVFGPKSYAWSDDEDDD